MAESDHCSESSLRRRLKSLLLSVARAFGVLGGTLYRPMGGYVELPLLPTVISSFYLLFYLLLVVDLLSFKPKIRIGLLGDRPDVGWSLPGQKMMDEGGHQEGDQ